MTEKATGRIRVLCWSEWSESKEVYPKGIHGEIAEYLNTQPGMAARTAQLDDPEQGLSQRSLGDTDVLVWFGHLYHDKVSDESVNRIMQRVTEGGMGFVPLHSSHMSRPLAALLGRSGHIAGWREADEWQRVEVRAPDHPVAAGVSDFMVPHDEMYAEPFDIPEPDTLVFYSYFQGGEEFRSGCAWTRGKGRIFYFQPGHETLPVFRQPEIRRVIVNAVKWTAGPT